ncbi:hypothetical protein GTQ34_14505 [Muricauda sp. JGD-17]|uniref:Uncharacterized protein n=1 Tax=Flagellimonas ochracea TaxID=2696472 RepID=A0A964TDX8_9FLAO|nr:hypothetical protein [Allomuricauda ochracea]NAY93124.1 hypothetical protein [Allomuricauda ochracea]
MKKMQVVSFSELEINKTTHLFGKVAQRFSTDEFVLKTPHGEYIMKGVNMIQLVKDLYQGWTVLSPVLSDENTYSDISKEYLNGVHSKKKFMAHRYHRFPSICPKHRPLFILESTRVIVFMG